MKYHHLEHKYILNNLFYRINEIFTLKIIMVKFNYLIQINVQNPDFF